jgi:hypothetical protein
MELENIGDWCGWWLLNVISGYYNHSVIWHINSSTVLQRLVKIVSLLVFGVLGQSDLPIAICLRTFFSLLTNLTQSASHHVSAGVLVKMVLLFGVRCILGYPYAFQRKGHYLLVKLLWDKLHAHFVWVFHHLENFVEHERLLTYGFHILGMIIL